MRILCANQRKQKNKSAYGLVIAPGLRLSTPGSFIHAFGSLTRTVTCDTIFLTFLVLLKSDLLEGTEDVLIKHGWGVAHMASFPMFDG